MENRINSCPSFVYKLNFYYCNVVIHSMMLSRDLNEISGSHCVNSVYSYTENKSW